ncbi:class I SAM-dependent methyltransferase [Desulfovibrio sp.]|uniref:class I SAM-dependent methyltransferase n=1 Tax=Desulfovibrio sp. TaxID=885 RepID=UPI003D0AF728
MLKSIIKNVLPFGLVEWHNKNKYSQKKFKKEFFRVQKDLEDNGRFTCRWEDKYPCLTDNTANTSFEPHYIYHPAWAARILAATMPPNHVDISSSLSFVTIASAFVPIEFYDLRPAQLKLENLTSRPADILSLPFMDNSITSLSCMHVVEHIGLGRYGDKHDPQGDIKAMKELSRVVAPGGQLLFVVPVAENAIIAYNAHRIYRYEDVICHFPDFSLKSFSLVTDDCNFLPNADPEIASKQRWGCGCFHFVKPVQ